MYLQIAENLWNPEKKRSETKIVCTLGRADGKGQERLKQLAASIRRHGSLETMAQMEPGWQFVDSWEHGPFHLICVLWERLGIRRILEEALGGEERRVPFERAILAMVANRSLAPASKLFCYESWLREDIYFPEGEAIELHHLYRAMDFLSAHKEAIEEALYWLLADLLCLDVDLIFYDTTTLYFEIDGEDEGEEALRFRGHSKDGRDDETTIEQVKETLKGWRLNRCLFVTDAGMVSEENLHTLARGGSSYVVAMPCRKGGEVVTEVLSRPGRFRVVCDNLHVKEVWVGEGQRRRRCLVCFKPTEAERQRKHREKVVGQLQAELAGLRDRGDGHPKRVWELLSSRRYGTYLRKLRDGRLKLNKTAIRAASKRNGHWVIRTNDESLSGEDLALAYKQLVRVEESWKTMKSGLKVRPIYHRTPERIRAHIFLCVLALLMERVVENGCGVSWARIKQELRSIKVGQLLTPNGTLYQRSPIRADSSNILQKLNVNPPPEILAVE